MSETIPKKMAAIAIEKPGGPDVLALNQIDVPTPQAGEVLIKVAAAGVNRPDIFQRMGFYPPPPGAPDTPGLEISGSVVALGPGVTSLAEGDNICALVAGGGYAEYCSAPASTCLPIPKNLTIIEAASLPETFFTVWSNVFDRARLKSGESFLVHGGTSGIGITAIQLAKAFGARVIATAGSTAKCEKCLELGADRAIHYRQQDFREVVKNQEGGVDVILDMVGGDYIAKNIDCLRPDGRHVSIAFLGGSKVTLDFMPIMMKRLTLTGSTLRPRDNHVKAAIAKSLREQVWPLLEQKRVRPVVDSTFSLDQAGAAHAHMESSTHMGKIVLTIQP